MDISQLQPGDKEDVLGRILDARHPSGALLGEDTLQRPSPLESLQRYKSLVNQIHPERCVDARAKEAFARSSAAFDAVCAMDSGCASTWEVAKSRPASHGAQSRWWEVSSVAEMQNLLDFRMAATKALYSEMACSLDAAGCEQLEQQILSAEKVSEHLDRLSEIKRNRFWPVSRGTPTPQQSALRYIDILCHLRGVHCFEQLHGRQYHHAADLQAATPLTQLGDLLRRCLQRSAPSELSMAASDGESDTDPLDRFMASIEAEVSLPHSGRAEVSQILREEPQGLADSGRPRLRPTATTSSTHLTAEGAVAEQRAAASAMAAADGQAKQQRQLQNQLLGDLESESEAEGS
ncbi:unnamed protein product [Effrenium voratum]|uniref:J domain-containing protein n=3 Tax=Effrenium voratum TaxID=2562239 RepID=A0AA36J9W8_9DINO|nr:unnamed protein product [Effrenium voratum]